MERRAETIKESRKYWKGEDKSKNQKEVKAELSPQTNTCVNNTEILPADMPGLSAASHEECTNSCSDMDISESGSVFRLLSSMDPSSITQTPCSATMSSSTSGYHVSVSGEANPVIKSLLKSPLSPVRLAKADTTSLDSKFHNSLLDLNSGQEKGLSNSNAVFTSSSILDSLSEPLYSTDFNSNQHMENIVGDFASSLISSTAESQNNLGTKTSLHSSEMTLTQNALGVMQPSGITEQLPTLSDSLAQNFLSEQVSTFSGSGDVEFDTVNTLLDLIDGPLDILDITLPTTDEDNLEKAIDQTIEAFDKQNFLTRGFLAKMPNYQQKFLVC